MPPPWAYSPPDVTPGERDCRWGVGPALVRLPRNQTGVPRGTKQVGQASFLSHLETPARAGSVCQALLSYSCRLLGFRPGIVTLVKTLHAVPVTAETESPRDAPVPSVWPRGAMVPKALHYAQGGPSLSRELQLSVLYVFSTFSLVLIWNDNKVFCFRICFFYCHLRNLGIVH